MEPMKPVESYDYIQRGDPGWLKVHKELVALHERKASTYGTAEDPLDNYVQTSEMFGEAPEYTCLMRAQEKLFRAINMYRAGRADEVDEYPDLAALFIGAEALRRRRLP